MLGKCFCEQLAYSRYVAGQWWQHNNRNVCYYYYWRGPPKPSQHTCKPLRQNPLYDKIPFDKPPQVTLSAKSYKLLKLICLQWLQGPHMDLYRPTFVVVWLTLFTAWVVHTCMCMPEQFQVTSVLDSDSQTVFASYCVPTPRQHSSFWTLPSDLTACQTVISSPLIFSHTT